MAKAKHPKLKWVKTPRGFLVSEAGFKIFRGFGSHSDLYCVLKENVHWLGYARRIAEAKAIAQAFADAETLRGEDG